MKQEKRQTSGEESEEFVSRGTPWHDLGVVEVREASATERVQG